MSNKSDIKALILTENEKIQICDTINSIRETKYTDRDFNAENFIQFLPATRNRQGRSDLIKTLTTNTEYLHYVLDEIKTRSYSRYKENHRYPYQVNQRKRIDSSNRRFRLRIFLILNHLHMYHHYLPSLPKHNMNINNMNRMYYLPLRYTINTIHLISTSYLLFATVSTISLLFL